MTNQTKPHIQQALQQFPHGSLRESSLHLLATLGYQSDRQLDMDNTPATFLAQFNQDAELRPDKAMMDDWQTIDLLCQITDAEIKKRQQLQIFDSAGKTIDGAIIESYVFMAIALRGDQYTRTQLAQITREVNKLFQMPVNLLFRHGPTLTIAIINRRLNKKDGSKDVLEKVTLIKDIRLANPHRAHIEILFDLSLDELFRVHSCANFVELHRAWQKTLDSSELNKKFFKEIANWYFWAVNEVVFPAAAGPDETRNATSMIRLITRLIFVWFLKEKGVIPDDLFNERKLKSVLRREDPQDSAYYKAILQNLFFATLNQEMNTPAKPDNRKFRGTRESGQSQHFMIHNVYRYEKYFHDPRAALALFADIPFLNGGLFECLDKRVDGQDVRIDGFSDRPDNPLRVPDDLFFGPERTIDLNETYGTSGKSYKVRGLIETLNRYKFTITENTPIEEEIALDPELLGKVFENLLAAYNPETGTTARKQTGSFYTPREIVNYMVDESLLAYLQTKVSENLTGFKNLSGLEATDQDLTGLNDLSGLEERLRHLFAYNEEAPQFNEAEKALLIDAIDHVNILDPACGSGAFPMGILHKLVFILGKLDPHNEQWKERQIEPMRAAIQAALAIPDAKIRARAIEELEEQIAAIEQAFADNELDYGRKLYLIENCIYGVDIQPVAVQIAKLRFFISLIVDQRLNDHAPNRGILPLPNLETKFVAANTLLGIEKPKQLALRNPAITAKEKELAEVRSKHFRARTPQTKEKWRLEDKRLRKEISALLQKEGNLRNEDVKRLAEWDPYNQNASPDFFDPEWMFGISNGFNVVIGNPPYGETIKEQKEYFRKKYVSSEGKFEIYKFFVEQGLRLLYPDGILCLITPDTWLTLGYFKKLRKYIISNYQILQLTESLYDVFQAASVDTMIIVLKNHKVKQQELGVIEPKLIESRRLVLKPYFDHEIYLSSSNPVIEKMDALERLGDYTEIWQGLIAYHSKSQPRVWTSNSKETPFHRKLLYGGDIGKYSISWSGEWLKYGNWLHRPRPSYIFDRPKILVQRIRNPQLSERIVATLDEEGYINGTGLSNILLKDNNKSTNLNLYYILGLLNSSLINFWFSHYFKDVNIKPEQLRKIPLVLGNNNQLKIQEIVEKILEINQNGLVSDISALKREIDVLVYDLYNLTPAEIALIEGREPLPEGSEPSGSLSAEQPPAPAAKAAIPSAPPLIFTGQPPQGSFSAKRARLDTLTKQATPAAIQELTAALTDDNVTIRWQASTALRKIGGPQVASTLQAFIHQTNDPAAKAEAEKLLAYIES